MKKGQYDQMIRNAAIDFLPYDWRIYKAQIFQESSFQPDAVSPAGARGLAQVMPSTWERYGSGDPFDPQQSLMAGARYMAYLYKQWSSPRPDIDRICLAMASYNAGLGNILKAQEKSGGKLLYAEIIQHLPSVTGRNAAETIDYVKKILGYWTVDVVTP